MFRDVLEHANLTSYATWGLVIFFVVFVSVAVWAFTRSRKQVRRWANLPLEDDPKQVSTPRDST